MSGLVKSIYITPNMGEAIQSLSEIEAIAGEGLRGDRYATGKGAYSRSKDSKVRHISFIASEAIAAANRLLTIPFEEDETRRNIVTQGANLEDLVNEEFRIGAALFRGTEPCDPCARPSRLTDKPGFMLAFRQLGGLRAEILQGGIIRVGQEVQS